MSGIADKSSILYKKDGEGATYAVAQSIFDGEIFNHSVDSCNVGNVLKKIYSFVPREEDVLMISYPKSGTHWMFEILSFLIRGQLSYNKRPTVESFLEDKQQFLRERDGNDPMIYFTHMKKRLIPEHVIKTPKVVYLLRNPKSVVSSWYSYFIRNKYAYYEGTFSGLFPVFLKEEQYSHYGNWFKHVTKYWAGLKQYDNVHFVVYEDLTKNPLDEVMKLSRFLGKNYDEAFCQQVVQMTSLEKMKKLEKERNQEFVGVSFKKGQEGIIKNGRIDGWKDYFTEKQNREFDVVFHKEFEKYPELKRKIQFE